MDRYARIVQAGVEAQPWREGALLMWAPRLRIAYGERPGRLDHEYEFAFDPPAQRAPEIALSDLRAAIGEDETIDVPSVGECRMIQLIVAKPATE